MEIFSFSHYFSRFAPTLAQVQTTTPDELGIGNVPDVYMMSYDARGRSLTLCDWYVEQQLPVGRNVNYHNVGVLRRLV